MSSGPKLDAPQREELLRLSVSDRTLERTRELMLLSAERFTGQPLSGMVRDFVRGVLGGHPAFDSQSLAGVLENLPEAASEEAAIKILWSQSFANLRWPEGVAQLKKNQAEQCRLNALYCLLLWFRDARGLSIDRLQRHLYTAAWEPATSRDKSDVQKLKLLMHVRDCAALGIACSTLERKAMEHNQQAIAARDAETRASARVKDLDNQLAQVSARLEAERMQVERLNADMSNVKREYENEKAHMRDDYEDLRGRLLRRLRQEVSLLDEGLHALKRQPPKVHVMVDHAERAIDGLKSEIDRIKGED